MDSKFSLGVKIRDAPDTGTEFAGYPANLKAGYRKSGLSFNSTFKYLVKYEINKDIKC
jgi:hypothetical protein